MPAREMEQSQQTEEAATEAVTPQPQGAEQQFTTEGDLPAIGQGSAAAAATASELAFDGKDKKASANLSQLDKGIHTWEHYRAECEKAGKPEKWKDHYRNGHTEAKGWKQPYETRHVNDFELKKNTSASQALKDFLAGPTITDYRAALLADEIDEVRDELGDHKFDLLFGSANSDVDGKIPVSQKLRISSAAYTTPLPDQMKAIAAEYDGHQNKPAAPETAEVEARVEERPQVAEAQQEPEVVRQELGLEQADRQLV